MIDIKAAAQELVKSLPKMEYTGVINLARQYFLDNKEEIRAQGLGMNNVYLAFNKAQREHSTRRAIFKCKRCKKHGRKHVWAQEYADKIGKDSLYRVVSGEKVWLQDDLVCPVCHSNVWTECNLVIGTVTDHVCSGVCMNATGGSCDCSCGGANHGKNHM